MLVSSCRWACRSRGSAVLRMEHRFGEQSRENEEGTRELDKDRKGVSKDVLLVNEAREYRKRK